MTKREREKFTECAIPAIIANWARYRGVSVNPDDAYMANISDERLRAIVRNYYGHEDVDALLAPL